LVAHASELTARATGGEPGVPLEGVRMARSTMFVDTTKAQRELGFASGSVEAALDRAVRWYLDRQYATPGVKRRHEPAHARGHV
jgi:dihydroflavonol-4-reductase